MKYNINVNQKAIVDNNLHKKTDLIDWAILEYICNWFFNKTNSKNIIFENEEYIWINYNHLIKEMPMIHIKTKDGISDRIKKLKKLNLIKTKQTKDNTLYARPTNTISEKIFFKS